jgi:hypothetical protein
MFGMMNRDGDGLSKAALTRESMLAPNLRFVTTDGLSVNRSVEECQPVEIGVVKSSSARSDDLVMLRLDT